MDNMTPDQAYKFKILVEKLREKVPTMLEDQAVEIVKVVMGFIVESALISKTPYDDVLALIVPQAEKKILADYVDKIDGNDDIQG